MGKERGDKWPVADMYDLVAGDYPAPDRRSGVGSCQYHPARIPVHPHPHPNPSPVSEYNRIFFQSQGGSMVTKIAEMLIRFKAIEFGDFTLASGAKSTYYVDVKTAVTNPELLSVIAKTVSQKFEFDTITGVAVGGVPLAVATALASTKTLCNHPGRGKKSRKKRNYYWCRPGEKCPAHRRCHHNGRLKPVPASKCYGRPVQMRTMS